MRTQEDERQEERLQTLLTAAYPAARPSDGLRQSIAQMATRHEERIARRAFWRGRVRKGLALAGATAILTFLVVNAPKISAAVVLQQMTAAMEGARSAHIVRWKIAPNGSHEKDEERWYQDGRSRTESKSGVKLFENGTLYTYEPRLNKVTIRRNVKGPGGLSSSGFTVASLKRDIARWGWKDKLRVLGETRLGGRSIRRVLIERSNEPITVLLLVDAATDLPFRAEMRVRDEPRWAYEMRYNEPLSARLFTPEFPKTAHKFDIAEGKKEWKRKLAKGFARQRIGERTIVLRDLQVNADGDVFLLYTAGKTLDDSFSKETVTPGGPRWYTRRRDWDVQLTDEFGTRYLLNELPLGSVTLNYKDRYVFQGERIEGDWWTPLTPQRPWKPRRFTLTFRVHPKNLHGEDLRQPQYDSAFKAEFTKKVIFTQRLQQPATEVAPEYMGLVNDLYQPEWQIPKTGVKSRAWYYRYEKGDLHRALELYRQLARMREEQAQVNGEFSHQPETWFDIYEVLRDLGCKDEARTALLRARDESIYRSDNYGNWKSIREALEREGLG
jgi:hypothetical protein